MRNPSSSSASSTRKNISSSTTSGGGCGKKMVLKRGPWTTDEDELLTRCINKEGEGKWRTLPTRAGLARCGKSCRLRWVNYLRPSVKRGQIAPDEEDLILRLHRLLGNRWSLIAGRIPGRTDNEIKNYWNTHLSKKLISQGIDPKTHKPLLQATCTNQLMVGSKPGKKLSADDSGSSKFVSLTHQSYTGPTTMSSARNPTSVAHGFEEESQTVREEAGCCSDGTNINVRGCLDDDDGIGGGGYHVNLEQRSSQAGVSNEDDADAAAAAADGINCEGMVEDDGVFSSFLNSLINDEMFV